MNLSRVAMAAVAAWIADFIYGFVVYATLLGGDFGMFPGVFRPMAEQKLAAIALGTLIGIFALAWIYAKGYEGGSGVAEGLRFGIALAVFSTGYIALGNYGTLNISAGLAGKFAVAGFVEMLVVGTVIGAVYKPAVGAKAGY